MRISNTGGNSVTYGWNQYFVETQMWGNAIVYSTLPILPMKICLTLVFIMLGSRKFCKVSPEMKACSLRNA